MKLSHLVSIALARTWHELNKPRHLTAEPTLRRKTETREGVTYVGIPNKIARRMGR